MLNEIFFFNGVKSSEYGVYMMRDSSSGMVSEEILGSANLTEVELPNDFKPHLQKVERSPIEFTRQLVLLDEHYRPLKWTKEKRAEIFSWLFHNEYKELGFSDNSAAASPDFIFFAIATNAVPLKTLHEKGYLEITFRTNSPYAWLPKEEHIIVGGSTAVSETISVKDYVVETIKPKITITRTAGQTQTSCGLWLSGAPTEYIRFQVDSAQAPITISVQQRMGVTANGLSLYGFKDPTSNRKWLELMPGNNTVFVSAGWTAKLEFYQPIINLGR